MRRQLTGISLSILLVILGYSPSLFAQEAQSLPPTEVLAVSSSAPTATVKPFATPDPEGLQRWHEFLWENPSGLPTAPGVTTGSPPQPGPAPLFVPPLSGQSPPASREGRPLLLPDPQGLQLRDFLQGLPGGLSARPEGTTDEASQAMSSAASSPSEPWDILSNDDNFAVYGRGIIPPDSNIGAGPNHIFQMVNWVGRITDKSRSVLQDFSLRSFFGVENGFTELAPRIIYDARSGRWFATYLEFDDTSQRSSLILMVSRSQTGDPTFTGNPTDNSYCRFYIGSQISNLPGVSYETRFYQDFAQLAVSDDKVVITFNAGLYPSSSRLRLR